MMRACSTMKGLVILCLVLLSLPTAVIFADEVRGAPPNQTEDGRFNTGCSSPNGASQKPICFVPLVRLIASPERYDGKVISVSGFFVDFHGQPTLFPSRESFEGGWPFEGVYIGGELPHDLRGRLKVGFSATIIGTFDGKFSGQLASLGAIWNALSIESSK